MGKEFTTVEIDNKICRICQDGSETGSSKKCRLSIFYWGVAGKSEDLITASMSYVCTHLRRQMLNVRFLIVAYESENWNDDFSPWKAQAVFGNEEFGGKADKTLEWLMNKCIPYIDEAYVSYIKDALEIRRYAVGYSLAGLFSLWAYGECSLLTGAVSCSGSLWYKGWLEYVETHWAAFHRNRMDCIYLSLGSKEEKTKNSLLSTVGDNTRKTYKMLCGAPEGVRGALEWNAGGHFSDPGTRIAKGIYWILSTGGV
ncbi:MAG: alpha/beta hydrolase [Lachnospiraceae bacterium]|nr:alpha/beta hydrolase [Lachnospiraceae bacterium]